MAAAGYLFEMVGGVPVVTAPAEIDTTTAGQLRAILFEWQSRGHTTVVVDLTGTEFCDSTGLRELVWAHKRAVADGGGLRLVVRGGGVFLRIFTVAGLDGIIPSYATLGRALSEAPADGARPLRRGPAPADRPAGARGQHGPAAGGRSCEQCGVAFTPQREHARFCSGDCRAAWNRAHLGDPAVDASALTWSTTAMSEAIARLPAVKAWDQAEAFAAIGEAVWWITMVDATLVRHHQQAYDTVLAAHPPAGRQGIKQTLAGLRFVRNLISRQAGLDEVIDTGTGTRRITGWTWKPLGEPALGWLPAPAQAWELARYHAYQTCLAHYTVGATFGQAAIFLTRIGADAASTTDTSQHAT